MIFKSRDYIVFLIIWVLLLSTGCSSNNSTKIYNDAADKFNTIYFKIVEDLETSDAMKTMSALQADDKKKNIEELGKLLEPIKENIPKNKEILYKKSFKARYDDLALLKDSYTKFDGLGFDEKHKIDWALINTGMNMIDWKKKKTIWK